MSVKDNEVNKHVLLPQASSPTSPSWAGEISDFFLQSEDGKSREREWLSGSPGQC
jgi:hypothetical protein